MLGITWNAYNDEICYSAHAGRITGKVTKRSLLSDISKIFDPLGLLGPVVLYAKRLMTYGDSMCTGTNPFHNLFIRNGRISPIS